MERGEKITFSEGVLRVPETPIIPFIEGDGTGPDIWRAAKRVMDRAVEICWKGRRRIAWKELLAGEKAFRQKGEWLPPETIDAFRDYRVGIKGPLTTPVGEGIRSLNVALRQRLDLYACVRPFRRNSHALEIVQPLPGVDQFQQDDRRRPEGPLARQ